MATPAFNIAQQLTRNFLEKHPEESALVLEDLPAEEILDVLQNNPVPQPERIFFALNPDIAIQTLLHMKEHLFQSLFSSAHPAQSASLLARLDSEQANEKLALLSQETAHEIRELMTYPPDSAGSLMDPQVTFFRSDDTVEQALSRIRTQQDRQILDLCVTDLNGHLIFVLPLREVAIADPQRTLGELNNGRTISVHGLTPREDVVDMLEEQNIYSLPVVDIQGKLLGVIRNDALIAAVHQDASESLQAMVGAGREERALSKVTLAVKKRLPWLQINLGTAFLAAAVVGLFEDIIAKFTALAILLPVVAGQSGNTGAQALAVTMRGLALREVRVRDWLRIVRKEVFVGFLNGCGIGLTTAFFVYLFMGQNLAIVIGVSMILSMICASLAGAAIPIVLTAIRQDPAQSASIILTTVTDVMGFLSFLGFATLLANVFQVPL